MGRARLDPTMLAHLEPAVERDLKRRVNAREHARNPCPLNLSVLVEILFRHVDAPCGREDQSEYLLFVAPIARRVLLTRAFCKEASLAHVRDLEHIERWLARVASFDPLSALMIDLRYFSGLSVRQTALALGISVRAVLRDLRFAKDWLAAYLGRPVTRELLATL